MKEYKKIYEDHARREASLKKCNIDWVETLQGIGPYEYIKNIRKSVLEFQKDSFDHMVKFYWLSWQYVYAGTEKRKARGNGFWMDGSWGLFMRNHVGLEHFIITQNRMNGALSTYFEDFFPDFTDRDPFKEKMEYPYKHVTLEFLLSVYQMPERLDLLKIAEDRKMSYLDFIDYVANHVNCQREELDAAGDETTERFVYNRNHAQIPNLFSKVKNLKD